MRNQLKMKGNNYKVQAHFGPAQNKQPPKWDVSVITREDVKIVEAALVVGEDIKVKEIKNGKCNKRYYFR